MTLALLNLSTSGLIVAAIVLVVLGGGLVARFVGGVLSGAKDWRQA